MAKETLCPGCGELNRFFEVEKIDKYSILRCPACSLEFSSPMASPGSDWYDKAYVLRHAAIDARVRDYYRWVVASLPVIGKLLDIGCGEGVFVNYAKGKGFDAFGIDFSRKAIEIGRKRYGLTTIYSYTLLEAKEIMGWKNWFDIVTFFEALEHMESPKKFLEEVKTILKTGGCVAGSVPFKDRWPLREFNDYPPHHLTRWSEASLNKLFQTSGFKVVKMEPGSGISSYHMFLAYLMRVIVYKVFGYYKKGLTAKKETPKLFKNTKIKYFLSIAKPREIRDILLWPVAILTYPFVYRWFKGYNLMFVARREK